MKYRQVRVHEAWTYGEGWVGARKWCRWAAQRSCQVQRRRIQTKGIVGVAMDVARGRSEAQQVRDAEYWTVE
eukprot:scaffold54682_cov31-Tisochrysis_lutea.AAC.3